MTAPQHYKWFFETTTPVEGHMHAIARTIVSRQTKYQFMEILETHSYGKCLVLDGRIQSSQAGGSKVNCSVTRSQNVRSRSTRRSGGLPAIKAELTAPIEMPTIQLGVTPASAKPSYTPA